MNLNFSEIDLEQFFGWVNASNTTQMKSPSFRGLRAHYTEKSFCKWANDQLIHVGLFDYGRDFVIKKTKESVEMKSLLGMFTKDDGCKTFTLKNFHPSSKNRKEWKKEDLIKTFDYMLLIDTKKMSIGYTTWEKIYNRIDETSNDPKVKLEKSDYYMIAKNVTPTQRECDIDKLFSYIEEYL
jgi:hypothetical protein